MVDATRLEPPVTEVTEPFWAATRDKRLLLQWCTDCDRPVWYPREVCPACLGDALEWRDTPGHGQVYACTVEYKPQNPAMPGPYVVALIELDEGVRLLANVVDTDPESVAVGDPVVVTWEELSDGRNLPLFRPAP
jgi:uncharacterized OB-fold protein